MNAFSRKITDFLRLEKHFLTELLYEKTSLWMVKPGMQNPPFNLEHGTWPLL